MFWCSANHPVAANEIVRGEDLLGFAFVDRLKCEFRNQIMDHLAQGGLLVYLVSDKRNYAA